MHSAAAERLEFAPPRDKGSLRALALALLVHILLIAALTWGVSWKRSDDSASFEAELWSGAAQQATPPVLETPAQPQPPNAAARVEPDSLAPVPAATPPQPAPVLPSTKAPAAAPPVQPDVDIALENEKKRQLAQQQKEAEQQKAQKLQEKREAELQARQTQENQKKKERELKAREELAERKAAEQAEKAAEEKRKLAAAAEKQKKAAAENQKQATAAANAAAAAEKQKLAAAAAKEKQAAAASEKKHQEEVKRMLAMANAAAGGGSTAEGAGSAKASGPSAGYAGKVKARVLPNVIFTDDIVGNPKAEVEVRTTPDGTIMSQRLVKSSGNKAWDDAVLKAIVRTGSLPRDIDGRVPTPMILEFRPY